jgi:protein phosphatase
VDHSFVQQLFDSGQLSREEAFSHPQKNVITRCLGAGGNDGRPEVYAFTPGPGEYVLLCSDGLSDALRDSDIQRVLRESGSGDVAGMLRALVDAANEAGGPDNITAILVTAAD